MITCRILLGYSNLDFSISCLQSCVENSLDPIQLEIFEDGSLSLEDIALLEAKLPNVTIYHKNDRDKVLEEKLGPYPKCKQMRDMNVFGYKLFDIMLYEPKNFFYLDTDIIFYRKFRFPKFGDPIFMKDAGNCYCFSDFMMFRLQHLLYPKINAGFFHFPPELFDLDFIENILNKYYTPVLMDHAWAEQTMWSFLARSMEEVYYFNEKHVVMPSNDIAITSDLVAIHFVRAFRDRIGNVDSYIKVNPLKQEVTTIGITKIASSLNIFSYILLKYGNRIQRKLKMLFVKEKHFEKEGVPYKVD